MIFDEIINTPAVFTPLNWNAEYENRKSITEYDPTTKAKNDFYKLPKEGIKRFGLFGEEGKYFIDFESNQLSIKGKKYRIEYVLDNGDKLDGFINKDNLEELTTLKNAYVDFYLNKQGKQNTKINSINFGCKSKVLYKGQEILCSIIVTKEIESVESIKVQIDSPIDLNGGLSIKTDAIERKFDMPVHNGNVSQIKWIIS